MLNFMGKPEKQQFSYISEQFKLVTNYNQLVNERILPALKKRTEMLNAKKKRTKFILSAYNDLSDLISGKKQQQNQAKQMPA